MRSTGGRGFAHLHVHSEYSLLDGMGKIDNLAERAASFDQPALAITDHGVMNGAVELQQACMRHGIKPIQGCEVYVTNDHREKGKRHHLTLIAQSDEGYRNLVKLCSAGFLEGLQRGFPTVDAELMAKYSAGIIALTGCLASKFCASLVDGRLDAARETADELIQIYGPEDVYFEIQQNGIPEQGRANEGIVKLASEFGRPLVATSDVHYVRKEDFGSHAALLCVQTKSTLANPKFRFVGNEFYLHSTDEMAARFAEWPEALETTVEIAQRCHVELELGRRLMPRFDCPRGVSEVEHLRNRVRIGLGWRYRDPVSAKAVERAADELRVIEKIGCSGYFLIVGDVIEWAREHGIEVGPGRGSAGGSIVNYALGITDVDPLRHDLLFERFLSSERLLIPDIDVDFSVRGRERVIEYVVEKYGKDAVAQIITFGKMFPRAAARDAARVLGYPDALGDKLSKLIPNLEQGRAPRFSDCLEPGQPLALKVARDADAARVVEVAQGLEGIVRNSSVHAAAVVIAPGPVTDLMPVQLADARTTAHDGERIYRTVTQFSMKSVDATGVLRMDFLGLRNLDVIEETLDAIESSTGERPDMMTLPLDDTKTYAMLARGESTGVFQFGSDGMRDALTKVGPTEFDDLVALGAMYRPGAMDQIPLYAHGKHTPSSVEYLDARLIPILESTKGLLLYQEQTMLVSEKLAGFSAAQADELRRAIGKKSRETMAELQSEFVEGCRRSGTREAVIDQLWSRLVESADFSFNRSHAACYALISYRTAWLRANYPAEYRTAVMSSMTADDGPVSLSEAAQMGIQIIPLHTKQSVGASRGFVDVATVGAAEEAGVPGDASILTGIGGLDLHFGGLPVGGITLLAAVPSMGTSSLACELIRRTLATSPVAVCHFAPDGGIRQTLERLARGGPIEVEAGRYRLHGGLGIRSVDVAVATRDWVADTPDTAVRLVVVDGLAELVDIDARPSRGASAAAALRELAAELNAAVILTARLPGERVHHNRHQSAVLSDLDHYGRLVGEVDVAIMLHREEYYARSPERPRLADLRIWSRAVGPVWWTMRWDRETLRFSDYDS